MGKFIYNVNLSAAATITVHKKVSQRHSNVLDVWGIFFDISRSEKGNNDTLDL